MAITNITVSNFKSFKDLDLALGRFNVVIGANASGKSNFVEIFKFLQSLERNSIEDAVSLHGGASSILNRRLGSAEPLRMRATSDRQMPWIGGLGGLRVHETTYGFSLTIQTPQDGVLIKDDHCTQKLRIETDAKNVEMRFDVLVADGQPRVQIGPQELVDHIADDKILSDYASLREAYKYMLIVSKAIELRTVKELLIHGIIFGIIGSLDSLFGRVGIYDLEPHAIKKPHETAGIPRLQKNGENLALVLKQILADPEKSRKFHNLLRYVLPFAVEIGTEQYLGESVLLRLREEYYEGNLLANLLSDGTVDVAALITALFFEDKDVVIIEEPERNIHPHLISGLMELMKDASRNKQIIITTHSPEVVRHAGVENLLLISRDKEGFSTISRPAEKQDVKIFLENNLGLDEVFVQELWGM